MWNHKAKFISKRPVSRVFSVLYNGTMFKLISGGCLIFIALVMLLGFLASTTPAPFLVDAVMLTLLVVGPAALGTFQIRNYFRAQKNALLKSKKELLIQREKEVLRLAKQNGGLLSVSDIVSETSMDIDEADAILREFVIKRMADIRTADNGAVTYEFFDLLRDSDAEDDHERSEPDRLVE